MTLYGTINKINNYTVKEKNSFSHPPHIALCKSCCCTSCCDHCNSVCVDFTSSEICFRRRSGLKYENCLRIRSDDEIERSNQRMD